MSDPLSWPTKDDILIMNHLLNETLLLFSSKRGHTESEKVMINRQILEKLSRLKIHDRLVSAGLYFGFFYFLFRIMSQRTK